ncbi:MAG: hypothetical protein CMB80_10985 [Flammeovirgaceae bacterium]|nr:hypothetical protein [Flammeovirgaceae bacterium]
MTDRVVNYGCKSLAYHIETDVTTFDNVYVVTPDFDWDKRPDPNDPSNRTLDRALPFAGIVLSSDITPPFSMGNILYEQNFSVAIDVLGSTYSEMTDLTADMKQSLKTASNPITGSIGIVLYNFAVASGVFYANAGTLQVDLGESQYFGPPDEDQEENRKYHSITLATLSAYKDSTATLLENKGRVNLTDS